MGCAGSCALGGQTAGHSRRTMHLIEPTGGERHVFHEKVLKKKRLCAACSEPVVSQGSVCRVCKIISHKKCEGKVLSGCSSPPPADMRRRTAPGPSIQHMGSTKSLNLKQRSSLPRSFSSLDHVIQRSYDLDLTYITERIISVFFPTSLEQQRYRSNLREVASMLRSKHEDKYLLFNLSKKRHDISRLNPKVQDFFWPDCHAPPLDIICSICKAMEAWLNSDPQHVVVLHCKGNQGKTGVVIASYMHYSKVSASVDQALSTLAMRKFCEDKVSVSLHPSQRRYINYFGGLLSGTIKISSDMLSLQCVLLPVIPALQTDGGFCPFLKIYQSMQLVYTSGIYLSLGSATAQKRQLCISLEPALLLKGDIMVKCYHKRCKDHEREVLFRLQFHTCTIHNTHLCFSKDQLDCACTDDRFPEDAVVEFIFSSGNDKSKGREVCRKDPDVSVDYDITDPLVRFDSYENLNVNHEDSLEDLSHTRGPLDGSLYARVKKKSTQLESSNGSPEQHGRLLSVSSDSGHSSAATERLEETPQKSLPTAAEREDLERLLGGFGVQVKHEGEPQYSQVLKHEEVSPQHGNQRQNVEERPQDLQHRVHMEGTNQNMQTKMNGEARPQFSPIWSGLPEDGASQHLPLASSSWEGQRETTCETHWEGQREREAAIMEEEMGQFGELSVFPGRRPLVSRHCSCRLGYAGPNIEGPPNRSYFRTENILDPRGTSGTGVVVPAAHYPGMYGEHERRRLYRSLSEGPQHYPSQAQSPPKRGSLRDTRPYLCQAPPTHEPLVPPLCPCSHCQNSACYPVPNMQPFHRGELPLHMSQPYGQSVQASHDFPHPFQMPQAKMHYGYSTAHGEDALHYNHFTEGGYGHSYPHFLHPSYLPTHCPPNGYGAHSFPSSMSPYSPPGRQSPPSGSVSPVIPSSSARRRMSGDTTSAGSASELPSPEQKHEHCDRVTRLDAPSFQPQKHGEAGCAATSSAAHVLSPLHTSTPMNTQTNPPSIHSPVHSRSPAQTDTFMYPQSPVNTQTPITTHCQSVQTHTLAFTQSVPLQSRSPGHTCPTPPTLGPCLQTDQTSQQQSPSVQTHNPVLTHNPVVQLHSSVHTIGPSTMQTHNLVHTHSLPGQVPSPVHSQNPSLQSHNPVLSSDPSVQLHSPVHTQTSLVQSESPILPSNPSLQLHSPGLTQSPSVQSHSPVHVPSPSVQSHSPVHVPSPSVQSQSPVHVPSPSVQSQSPVHVPSPSVQSHSHGHTHSPSVQEHSPRHTHDKPVQTHSSVDAQSPNLHTNNQLNTQSYLKQSDSPEHIQNHNSIALKCDPPGQTHHLVHTQSSNAHTHSTVHTQVLAGQASIAVHNESPSTLTSRPQQQSVQAPSSMCTDNPHVKTLSQVHTQSHLVQTDISVHTQTHSIQSQNPEHKVSPQVQLQNTVHTQSSSAQTYRNTGNHNPGYPQSFHSHSTSPSYTERTGFTLPHVSTYSANEENKVMPNTSSPSHVTKVAPQLLVMPETKTEITRGQSSFGSVICSPNEAPASPAGRYTVAFGAGYNAQYSPVSKNSVTPQKRSITISLPAVPVNQHGGEAPTSSPLSPMGSQSELLPPSPTPSFPISTAYYTGSPCPPHMQPPRLPEKFHQPAGGDKPEIQRDCNGSSENSRPALSSTDVQQETPLMGNFVQDSSKFWYKPTISREQAIALLRGADAGSFLIRDSNSFRGAYGLALKVSSPPQNIMTQSYKGDPAEQLVRHFLIETGPKGVKIKGSPIEPHFGSLSALVSQHSVTPLSLPCRLRIPCRDLTEQSSEVMVPTNMSTAADLLRQGAACSVLYLGSVDTESLTGPQAISRASNAILTPPRSSATIVHFKVSEQGITLTDSQRKLFFRRHYPVSSVTFCSADPQDRRWTNPDRTTSKVFGFVARKAGTAAENVCHLFAELDPEQPASAIVNFVTKVMLGSQRR